MAIKSSVDSELSIFGQKFAYNIVGYFYVLVCTRRIDMTCANIINQWQLPAWLGPVSEMRNWFISGNASRFPFRTHWLRCAIDHFESGGGADA